MEKVKKRPMFPDGEKRFLNDRDSIKSNLRGTYIKRIKERLEDLNNEEFYKAIEYVPYDTRLKIVEGILETLPVKQTRLFLKNTKKRINSLIKPIKNRYIRLKEKTNLIRKAVLKYTNKDYFKIFNYGEWCNLINKLSKKRINKKLVINLIKKIENSKKYVISRKLNYDKPYILKKNITKQIFTLILNKKKVTGEEIKNKKFEYSIKRGKKRLIKTLKRFVEKGIISCQKTTNKNFIYNCKKKLIYLQSKGIGRTSGLFVGYKIIPFEDVCKRCNKNCVFRINNYTNILNKNIK